MGWTSASEETLEADDLLGSLAQAETEAGGDTLILTGDRDMYQCVDEHVHVLYLKSGTTGFEEVDAAEVRRRYGIGPELVTDFIALRGDPSDGLPGAPGIGAKTAADLLQRHGTLEGAIENCITASDPRSPQRSATTPPSSAPSRTSPRCGSVEIARPPDGPTDLNGGAKAARHYGMNRLAERLEQATRITDL